MQDIYRTFEFEKIIDHVLEYTRTERGSIFARSLKQIEDYNSLNDVLEDLKETLSLVSRYGDFPLNASLDALRLIDEAKKTSILTEKDLDMIASDVLTSAHLVVFINKLGDTYPRIKKKIESFADLSSLEKEIHRCISSSQSVKDDASPELKEIRHKIKKMEASLLDKMNLVALRYSSIMNGENATLRDGHLVLPIKTADKSKISGIIYDVSDSGNTTFIEPMEIVELNNHLTSLRLEEHEEVRRILKMLTSLVLIQENEIINNNLIISELDFLNAKARYALEINADVAELDKEVIIDLKDARHPLIDARSVVANTYYADKNKRIVIISGPNAGGKTVSLKTVGLLTLMHLSGLAVSASKAKIGFFKNIFVDIGDNQSLSDNLSTFSAHMSQLGEILSKAGRKDLILLDELGTGTDPKEGEALAFAITKYLENKKSLAFISSHFDALKEYAFLSENLVNSSMLFNEETLSPTYVFKEGSPGKSYALSVATRYGISEDIVTEAKRFLEAKGESESSELIAILQKQIADNVLLARELAEKEEMLNKLKKRLEVDEANLIRRRDDLLKEVNATKEEMIRKAQEEIDFIISKLSNTDLKLHEIIELRNKLDDLVEEEEVVSFNEEISVGDYVSYPSLSITGLVKRIKDKKATITSESGLSFDVDIDKLTKIAPPKERKKLKANNPESLINTSVNLELNIIGLYVDEAKEEIIRYLDACRIKHFKQVRIIHGYGSGALRKLTRDILSKQKDLTYRPGGEHEGGGGATVVTFKDGK